MLLSKDLLSGLFFLVVGVFLVIESLFYPIGTLLRMGPGYFPLLVGALMALIGLGLLLQAYLRAGEKVPRPAVKPLLLVSASLFVFAISLDRLGLVISTVLLIVLSRFASPHGTVKGTIALAAVMVVVAIVIFHTSLDLPIKIWP
jgi:hypothetical protein